MERKRLLLCFMAALLAVAQAENSFGAQTKALASLKAAVTSDPRGALASWKEGSAVCTWHGVACIRGRVVGISLPRVGIQGSLPAELAGLAGLQILNLAGNRLTGTLPAAWSALASLERLSLDNNRLSGTLPAGWTTLDSLHSLNLANNQLSGSLPVEWGGMTQLLQLNLARNNLTGGLPASFGRLGQLTQLALGRNRLDGPLPEGWTELRNLLTLDLAGNQLSGTLPPAWGSALVQLTSLDASRNKLSGQLPPQWGALRSLQVLGLRGNRLAGGLPSTWNALAPRLYRADLSGNAGICGDMLDSLARACGDPQRNGTRLGEACTWQRDADALLAFKSSVTADPWQTLASWQPESSPCGPPVWQGVTCSATGRVTGVDLTGANLTGLDLAALAKLPLLQSVTLSGNNGGGALLPASWAGLRHLKQVSLAHAGLAGQLPEGWASLRALTDLSLQGNALTGSLPQAWAGMQSLRFLNLGHNVLNGTLPAGWSSLVGLEEAVLAQNQLVGPIPSPWTDLLSLAVLDLEGNTGICGGQPAWQAGAEVRVGSTNIHQSCLAAYASKAVVGMVVGIVLGSLAACVMALAALAVYVRRSRRRMALLQREHSAAMSPRQPSSKKLAALAADGRNASRAKLLVSLPGSDEINLEEGGPDYIRVAAQTPGPGASPIRPGYEPYYIQHEHSSPSPAPGMPSPERQAWQLAAYAEEHGADLVPRRTAGRRLFRSKSEAAQASSGVDLV